MIRVAVIDSGINPDNPHLAHVSGGFGVATDGTETGDWIDRLGHGTAVAAAIHEKAPDAELIAVKVFDRELTTTATALARAIELAADRGAGIINLSLGTSNAARAEVFAAAIGRARSGGAHVVAAYEHEGRPWWPGALPDVIGVVLDWSCPREEYRVRRIGERIVFAASGYPRDIPGVPREQNLKGISFAVANMTGFVARAFVPVMASDELVVRLAMGSSGPG